MEKILRGYIFRMYPTLEQQLLIEKSFGVSRYIYNYFLDKNKDKHRIDAFACIKELPTLIEKKEWLKEVDGCLLRTSIFNLEDSFKRYMKGLNGYPKFKSKNKSKKSYRTNNLTRMYKGKGYNSVVVDLEMKIIKLPKLNAINIKGYRKLNKLYGRIINATVSKEADKYYVSICVEQEISIPIIKPSKVVGIDVGIKDLLTTSDGIILENKKYIEKYEKKLKGLNRGLSRSKIGSKNRDKIIKKIQEVYRKLKNARKHFLHNISNELTKENEVIVTEKLNIIDMAKERKISKQIYDASWCEFIRQLEYKCKWRGKYFYQINPFYPSSQICNRCGYKERKVKDLSVRSWECSNCTNTNNRDINASINILWEGVKLHMSKEVES